MQRHDPRFDVSIHVDCASKAMFIDHRVTNISRGGLFIEGSSLPLDTELTLHLHLGGAGAPIEVHARVVWNFDIQKGSAHLVQGTGLRFVDLRAEDLRRLHAYLDSLAVAPRPTPVSPLPS